MGESERVTYDKSIGVIVFYKLEDSIKYLLLKHGKTHWAFAKGHPEESETEIETAKRELCEETGIEDIEFISEKILVTDEYFFTKKNKEKVKKTVHYFIGKAKNTEVKIDNKEITDYKWSSEEEAEKIFKFKESKIVLQKAAEIISNKNL